MKDSTTVGGEAGAVEVSKDQSVDESQITTMQATLKGVIDEDNQIKLAASIASANEIEDADLNEEADDFMETYLAVNLELKVREAQQPPKASSRMSRNNAKTVSSSKDKQSSPNMSRYHSANRLELQPGN